MKIQDPTKTLQLVDKQLSSLAGGGKRSRATVFALSDPGMVRAHNEDQFLVANLERSVVVESTGLPLAAGARITDEPSARLLVVADGMGGRDAGEVASAVVVDTMVNYAFAMMPWVSGMDEANERALAEGFQQAVRHAQDRVRQVAHRKGLDPTLGTTLTMVYVYWPLAYVVHIGDSRAYLFRGGQLCRLTRDQTVAQQLVEKGVMSPEDAASSSLSSVLTNALGGKHENVHAELHRIELAPGDLLLLCTDGLYGEVSESEIGHTLSFVRDDSFVQPAVERLVHAAKRAGGRDNVTAVLARF